MKPGSHSQINRAVALLLLALALAGFGMCGSTAALSAPRLNTPPAPGRRFPRPLSSLRPDELPLQRITQEQATAWAQQVWRSKKGFDRTNAPAPPATTPQFFDLTTTNPRPPLVGNSSRSREIHPTWSWDQQRIFFASNNVDQVASYGNTTPPANARFHLYFMTSDGAFIQQVTGLNPALPDEATGNQLFPALNHSQTKLAYVHRELPSDPFQLYVLDFTTSPPNRTRLTGIPVLNNPLNGDVVNVEKPTWAPGDGVIIFAARNRNVTNDVRNLYTVDLNSKVVLRLTNGTPANGVESFDPTYFPTLLTDRLAFASNCTGVGVNDLNYTRTGPLQDLDGDGVTGAYESQRNLFSMPARGAGAGVFTQLTSNTADDIEPVYNQSVYPPGQGNGFFHTWIAWASKGRSGGTTYDIYFNDGRPEGQHIPIRLFTPDTNAGAVPLNGSDEHYPTWSASLPPQNPIDRIAFSSNRQTTVVGDTSTITVSNSDTDIWSAEVTDITPPTLFVFDDKLGEVLHIANAPLPNQGRRLGAAGDTFYVYAKVKDLQYGLESVWAQIKDPDGSSTDNQRVNHRLYGEDTFPLTSPFAGNNVFPVRAEGPPPGITHLLHIPYETDFDGIGVSDYQYYSGQVRVDPAGFANNARYASFNPGVDDSVRWSGNQISSFNPAGVTNRPPLDASGNPRWLRLRDDGIFPDLVAGDDIYSASWVTPNDPSDYYVDLVCYDKAFDPRDPSLQQNWIIYDNIWGFSTQPFISQGQVLYVDDNGAGQKWPRGLKGSFRTFPTFRYGTESDIIDRPERFTPHEVRGIVNPNATNPPPYGVAPYNLRNISDPGSSAGPQHETWHFLNGADVLFDYITWFGTAPGRGFTGRAYRYDYWRILAKGPVPEAVLSNYAPITDEQPRNITGSVVVQQPVPRRAMVWNSPYCGDILLGSGSILDQATQTTLTAYKGRAGRMFIGGGDIVWAITGNGATPQNFVSSVLGVTFNSDEGLGNVSGFQGGPIGLDITQDASQPGNRNFAQGSPPPYWFDFYDPDPLGHCLFFPGFNPNPIIFDGNGNLTASSDGTPFQTQDSTSPVSGWEQIFANSMVANDDPATKSKTVFLSASMGSMARRYVALQADVPLDCMNYRAKISHAMFCWMFSTDLVGQVRSLGGTGGAGAPISGAFVQCLRGGNIIGAAFTRPDGTYTIRGLSVGGYVLRVDNPGFLSFQKATGAGGHGLDQARDDVVLTEAAPGSMSGLVKDRFNQPVPNVRIKATLQASPLFTGTRDFFATTLSNGTYLIPSAPTGNYIVIVDQLPPFFANASPTSQNATVIPAQLTVLADFTVDGQPAPLRVRVFEQLADGTRGAAVEGADVTLLDNANNPLSPPLTLLTDVNGVAFFALVPAGPINVTAFKFGFQEGVVPVNMPQRASLGPNDAVEVLVAVAQARELFGRVTRALDKAPLDAGDLPVTVRLLRASGQPTPLTADVFTPQATSPVNHNYRFPTAQDGRFLVAVRNHPRYADAQVTVDVTSNVPNTAPDLEVTGKDGVLKGTVREDVGGVAGAAIPGVTVTVISQQKSPGSVIATVTTAADGTWSTGTTPIVSDLYTVELRKFGFSQKTLTGVFLAGDTDIGIVLLRRSGRGQLYGLARRSIDGTPRPAVRIEFWTPAGSPFGVQKVTETTSFQPTTAAPDGGQQNYTAGSTDPAAEFLPEGDYDIRVTDARFAPFSRRATVTAAAATRVDLDLVPLDGTITGQVLDASDGTPIVAATVSIVDSQGRTRSTLLTDITGTYRSVRLTAGSYTINATAFGFVPGSVTAFVEGDTVAPTIFLVRVPPSEVTGTVRSSVDSAFVGDAAVTLTTTDGTNRVIATTQSTDTGSGSPVFNFRFPAVPPGTYTARAAKGGWQPAQRVITVNPGVALRGVSLTLSPDHTFGQGLLLISLPDDFPGLNAAGVLDQDPATFKSAYWLTSANTYAIYPDAEAAEFRLGKGMFVRFPRPTAFAKVGIPAPNAPFSLPVRTGWNLIGSVRRVRIEWLRVRVSVPGRTDLLTLQQAMDQGIIQNGLFGFVDGYFRSDFMDPFAGYFMRAFQDCTLVIPVDNSVPIGRAAGGRRFASRPAPSPQQVARDLAAAGWTPAGSGRALPARCLPPAGSLLYRVPALPVPMLFNTSFEGMRPRRRQG